MTPHAHIAQGQSQLDQIPSPGGFLPRRSLSTRETNYFGSQTPLRIRQYPQTTLPEKMHTKIYILFKGLMAPLNVCLVVYESSPQSLS